MKKITTKKKAVVAVVSVLAVFAIILTVAVEFFHIDFQHEKVSVTLMPDAENYAGGDGTEENPIYGKITPEIIIVSPRKFPWTDAEYRHTIYTETSNICIKYLEEYGQKITPDLNYKFVKGSPNSLTYKLTGAPNGDEYIVTINFKDKTNPHVSYVTEKN